MRGGLPSKNHNRGKNGRKKDKRKTENDVIGLDDERGIQQVEGELDITANGVIGRTNLPRMAENRQEEA